MEANMKKRYHIKAWGSDTLPDVDMYSDKLPDKFLFDYRVVCVQILEPVLLSELKKNILPNFYAK